MNSILKDTERRKKFHQKPGIYAILMGKRKGSNKDAPISFAFIDCSCFLFEKGTITCRSQVVDGILFEVIATVTKPLLDKDESNSLALEPLIMNIHK